LREFHDEWCRLYAQPHLAEKMEFPRRLTGDEIDDGFIALDDVIVALERSARLSDFVRGLIEAAAREE
jgi:hypothetical protein